MGRIRTSSGKRSYQPIRWQLGEHVEEEHFRRGTSQDKWQVDVQGGQRPESFLSGEGKSTSGKKAKGHGIAGRDQREEMGSETLGSEVDGGGCAAMMSRLHSSEGEPSPSWPLSWRDAHLLAHL